MLNNIGHLMKSKKKTQKKNTTKSEFPDITLQDGASFDSVVSAMFDPDLVEKVNAEMKKLKAEKSKKKKKK